MPIFSAISANRNPPPSAPQRSLTPPIPHGVSDRRILQRASAPPHPPSSGITAVTGLGSARAHVRGPTAGEPLRRGEEAHGDRHRTAVAARHPGPPPLRGHPPDFLFLTSEMPPLPPPRRLGLAGWTQPTAFGSARPIPPQGGGG